jgi:hypothetical protein
MDRLSECYGDIDGWLVNYRSAHPEDDRADLDILLDSSVYNVYSPYWPVQEGK